MEAKQPLLLTKKHGLLMISALLQDELKYIFIIFSAAAVYMEMCMYTGLTDITPDTVNGFVFSCAFFSLLFSVTYYILSLFSQGIIPVYGAVLAGAIISFFLRNSYFAEDNGVSFVSAGMAAGVTCIVWFILHTAGKSGFFEIPLCIACDAVMVFLFFKAGYKDNSAVVRLAVAFLFALSLSYFRDIALRKDAKKYPFILFAAIALCIAPIPVREEPINWSPVIEAGIKVRDKTKDIMRSVSYYGSEFGFRDSYRSGYSDLSTTGEAIYLNDRAELTLTTNESTAVRYIDETTGKRMKQSKAVYLAGGRAADNMQLLDIIYSLYLHGVDYSDAGLFLNISRLSERYVYLKTADEIIPLNSIIVSNKDGRILSGNSGKKHRKGYSLNAEYLDIDFGSPYL
ncbi:MAG: hypothetical protein K6E53_11990, partial [Lachnospiraceae bacterium]|nr:hypothetical protein [Lachnospiraceae bacterium]